jgi:hypothetical protein
MGTVPLSSAKCAYPVHRLLSCTRTVIPAQAGIQRVLSDSETAASLAISPQHTLRSDLPIKQTTRHRN